MGVSSIDILQTEQIEDLQDDVKELREKINLLVSDIKDVDGVAGATRDGLTKKLNDAILDADDLNTVINAGYTTASGGGSATNTGILKRLDDLFQELEDHRFLPTTQSVPGGYTYKETHPPANSGSPVWQTPGTSVSNLDGTVQGSATRTDHVATATSVDAAAPVYAVEPQSVITLKTSGERRARHLARKIQGQITEEDRVNTNK
jgi:uncharacterized phage infection (PIP) family protein YhgE